MVLRGLRLFFLALLFAIPIRAQVGYPPIRFGATAPATCNPASGPGERNLFWDNNDYILYYCSATNTWTQVGSGGGHNLLSVSHQDTTAASVARGGLITGQGVSPTWSLLVKGTASQCLMMDGTATDIVWAACPGAGGGDSLTVATVAATDPDFIDSTRIALTLSTVPTPDTISWDIIANSIDADEINEAATFAFAATTNTFVATSYIGPTADPADSGVFRGSNAEVLLCSEAAPAGTDVCLTVDSSEIIQVTGGTLDAADLSGTVPDASVDGANEAGEIDIDNLAGLTAIASALTATNATNSFTGAAFIGPTADPADAGVLRCSNNESCMTAEAATPGTDLILKFNATDQLETTATAFKMGGTGTWTFTNNDTNGGFAFVPNGTGDFTFGVGQAFTMTFDAGATDPVIDFSSGNIKYSGATTYTWEGGASDPILTPGNGVWNLTTGTLQEGGVAVSLPARSETLTEKTLNVESSNNLITTVSKVWIDAAACVAGTAATNWDMPDGAGDAQPTAACNDTGTIQRPTLSFSGSAVNGVERTIKLPSDWTGNIDLDISYLSTAASPTGNVEWEIQTICRAVAETWDAAFNAAQTITDAQAAQNTLNAATQAALTVTTCAAGEFFSLRIWRDGTNDTSNDVALMLGAELTLRRAM